MNQEHVMARRQYYGVGIQCVMLVVFYVLSAQAQTFETISSSRAFIKVTNVPDFKPESQLCRAGDIDGDGYGDFAIAAPGEDMSDLGQIIESVS